MAQTQRVGCVGMLAGFLAGAAVFLAVVVPLALLGGALGLSGGLYPRVVSAVALVAGLSVCVGVINRWRRRGAQGAGGLGPAGPAA